eukprot:43733-Chlamydomonas_euryale.AAC.12
MPPTHSPPVFYHPHPPPPSCCPPPAVVFARQVRLVMWQLLAATAAAHARGVIHRDINPTNILLEGDGTVKLADFGLARSVDVPGVRSASAAYTA